MKAKLIVEGKEFPIEIQDPELQKLLTSQKKTGYERVDVGQKYWVQNIRGDVCCGTESIFFTGNNEFYDSANYYSDETIAKNNSRADKLMRQLRRFAVEHSKSEIDWNDESQCKYYIYNETNTTNLDIDYCHITRYFGGIYFDTAEAANLAISTFRDELIWYFTEYKDSL